MRFRPPTRPSRTKSGLRGGMRAAADKRWRPDAGAGVAGAAMARTDLLAPGVSGAGIVGGELNLPRAARRWAVVVGQ